MFDASIRYVVVGWRAAPTVSSGQSGSLGRVLDVWAVARRQREGTRRERKISLGASRRARLALLEAYGGGVALARQEVVGGALVQ